MGLWRKIWKQRKIGLFKSILRCCSPDMGIGMSYRGIFMQPALPDGHWLKEHKLYSIDL